MATIWIYGDESGTMPARDQDGPFVAAVLASPRPITGVEKQHCSVDWLVQTIRAQKLRPYISYVKPQPGFSALWSQKADQMETMARARRLVIGRHEYLPKRGMPRRNHIWIRAMQQALLRATLGGIFGGAVAEISLILDRKTLASETERFMRDRVDALVLCVRDQLLQLRGEHPEHAVKIDGYRKNLEATVIGFAWGSPEGEPGLWLSDHLARLAHRELMGDAEVSLFAALEQDGHRHFLQDVAATLVRPISDEATETWRRETGLPVPKI